MNDSQRLHLQKMIKANNVEDQTNLIRQLKHSVIIQNEVNNMVMLKAKYRNDPDKLNTECMQECGFLFAYYTDLYNKIKKDEIWQRLLIPSCCRLWRIPIRGSFIFHRQKVSRWFITIRS